MKQCYSSVNLSSNDIVYVEAHGTGTSVGDGCEVKAIVDAYCEKRKEPLLIGSVKTNIGHTEASSALSGISKVLIMFENNIIPSDLHLKKIDSKFMKYIPNFFKPITKNVPLPDGIVAVNSLGVGGTNAHLLLKPNNYSHHHLHKKNNIPIMIPLFGRCEEGLEFQRKYFKQNNLTEDFYHIYNDISNVGNMKYHSFIIKTKNNYVHGENIKISSSNKLCFVLPGKK